MIPVILKGDTTAKISLNVADGWDYTGVALDVEFCGVVKTFVEPVAGSVIDVVYAADDTARFPLGTHKVIMTLRGEGGERSTLPWGKIKVTDAPAEVYDAKISVDPGTIAVEDATAADSLGEVKTKLNAVLEYLRGLAVTACVAVAVALPCFGGQVAKATLNDLPGTAAVVTNVTLPFVPLKGDGYTITPINGGLRLTNDGGVSFLDIMSPGIFTSGILYLNDHISFPHLNKKYAFTGESYEYRLPEDESKNYRILFPTPARDDTLALKSEVVTSNDLAAVTSTIPETVTNVVRDVQGLVYDEKLGITWKQTMFDGNLYYVAVTNANITEVK